MRGKVLQAFSVFTFSVVSTPGYPSVQLSCGLRYWHSSAILLTPSPPSLASKLLWLESLFRPVFSPSPQSLAFLYFPSSWKCSLFFAFHPFLLGRSRHFLLRANRSSQVKSSASNPLPDSDPTYSLTNHGEVCWSKNSTATLSLFTFKDIQDPPSGSASWREHSKILGLLS